MMKREQLIAICIMRIDGYSLQDIADEYNVSKQHISDLLHGIISRGRRNIIYPNLKFWLAQDKNRNKTNFAKEVGVSKTSMMNYLKGRVDFPLNVVRKISDITGLTIEQVIEKETEK